MKDCVSIYFDGACDNNSKLKMMGVGCAVFINDEYKEDLSQYKMLGTNGTNNIAEWYALESSLALALELVEKGITSNPISIYGDSQLIVNQFNGLFKVKKQSFKRHYRNAKVTQQKLGSMLKRVTWIPREYNAHADELSKRAIKEFIKENFNQ